jgi:acetyl esterase/lipase
VTSEPTTARTEPATLHDGPPVAGPSRGAVLVLPGGGYQVRSADEGAPVAAFLAASGVRAHWLDYPVAPARYPVALHEVLRAVADLRAGRRGGAPVDGPVAVLGFSAGGHLAGTAATATDAELRAAAEVAGLGPAEVRRPDAAVLCYPVVSLVDHPHLGSRLNLVGDPDDAAARALSVELRVDAATPPTFLWHTAEDGSVDVENALVAAAALHRHRVPVELHVYPHGKHGLNLAVGHTAGEWAFAAVRWLGEQGIGSVVS